MCHDGHDVCGNAYDRVKSAIRSVPGARYFGVVPPKLAQSANWLEGFLEPILADDRVIRNTLVVVTFDESLSDDNNHIYTVFLGDMVRPGARVDGCYDHYDLLRTIEENFGLGTLGAEVIVRRNDAIDVEEVPSLNPKAIVLSPGPCTPHEAGVTVPMIRRWGRTIPMLGV